MERHRRGTFDVRGDMGFLLERWAGFLGVERHQRDPYDLTPATFDTTGPGFTRYDYLAKISRDLSETIKLSLLATLGNMMRGPRLIFTASLGPSTRQRI